MKSWKTTLGGSLGATGAFLFGVPVMLNQFTELKLPFEVSKWSVIVGIVLTMFGVFFNGFFGRDNNVTSEDVAAEKNKKTNPIPEKTE